MAFHLSAGPIRSFVSWTQPISQTLAPRKWCHIHCAQDFLAFFYLFEKYFFYLFVQITTTIMPPHKCYISERLFLYLCLKLSTASLFSHQCFLSTSLFFSPVFMVHLLLME